MSARRRLPGTTWRFLAHGAPKGRNGMYGAQIADSSANHPASVFDELVVDRWFHMEQVDTDLWWISVAGVVLFAKVDRDGKPKQVTVWSPGEYDDPIPGVIYKGAVASEDSAVPTP